MFGHVGYAGPLEPHGHVSINDGWTSLIFVFDHHHCPSCPLLRLFEGLEASKKVSNCFYNVFHAVPTSYLVYRYPRALVDDLTSDQHPTSFRGLWVIYGCRECCHATKKSHHISPPLS